MAAFSPEDRRLLEGAIERFMRAHEGDARQETRWARYAELGWLALPIEPEHGGLGGGALELGLVVRAFGSALWGEPYLATIVIGASLIERAATPAVRARLLPQIASGVMRLALATQEPGAGHARDFITASVKNGRLTGAKLFVLHADAADMLLVTAREKGDLHLFAVDPRTSGVALNAYRAPDNRMVADIAFQDARAERLSDMPIQDALNGVLDLGAAAVCAEAIGAIGALNRLTLEYAKTRRQFGVPIGCFQVLQHRLVDMLIAERQAAAVTASALEALAIEAPDAALKVSVAKARVDQAGRFVGESALQIHGGMGMTDECAVGRYLKRLITIASQFGGATWHLDRIAALTL